MKHRFWPDAVSFVVGITLGAGGMYWMKSAEMERKVSDMERRQEEERERFENTIDGLRIMESEMSTLQDQRNQALKDVDGLRRELERLKSE